MECYNCEAVCATGEEDGWKHCFEMDWWFCEDCTPCCFCVYHADEECKCDCHSEVEDEDNTCDNCGEDCGDSGRTTEEETERLLCWGCFENYDCLEGNPRCACGLLLSEDDMGVWEADKTKVPTCESCLANSVQCVALGCKEPVIHAAGNWCESCVTQPDPAGVRIQHGSYVYQKQ